MIEWNAQVNDKTIKSLIKVISIGTIEIANGTVPSNFYYQPKKSEIISALLRDRMCIRNYKKTNIDLYKDKWNWSSVGFSYL